MINSDIFVFRNSNSFQNMKYNQFGNHTYTRRHGLISHVSYYFIIPTSGLLYFTLYVE